MTLKMLNPGHSSTIMVTLSVMFNFLAVARMLAITSKTTATVLSSLAVRRSHNKDSLSTEMSEKSAAWIPPRTWFCVPERPSWLCPRSTPHSSPWPSPADVSDSSMHHRTKPQSPSLSWQSQSWSSSSLPSARTLPFQSPVTGRWLCVHVQCGCSGGTIVPPKVLAYSWP